MWWWLLTPSVEQGCQCQYYQQPLPRAPHMCHWQGWGGHHDAVHACTPEACVLTAACCHHWQRQHDVPHHHMPSSHLPLGGPARLAVTAGFFFFPSLFFPLTSWQISQTHFYPQPCACCGPSPLPPSYYFSKLPTHAAHRGLLQAHITHPPLPHPTLCTHSCRGVCVHSTRAGSHVSPRCWWRCTVAVAAGCC